MRKRDIYLLLPVAIIILVIMIDCIIAFCFR